MRRTILIGALLAVSAPASAQFLNPSPAGPTLGSSARAPSSVARMYEAVVKAAKIPAVRERLDPTGAEIVASNPKDFSAWLAAQRTLLGNLITEANIKLG